METTMTFDSGDALDILWAIDAAMKDINLRLYGSVDGHVTVIEPTNYSADERMQMNARSARLDEIGFRIARKFGTEIHARRS